MKYKKNLIIALSILLFIAIISFISNSFLSKNLQNKFIEISATKVSYINLANGRYILFSKNREPKFETIVKTNNKDSITILITSNNLKNLQSYSTFGINGDEYHSISGIYINESGNYNLEIINQINLDVELALILKDEINTKNQLILFILNLITIISIFIIIAILIFGIMKRK